MLRKSMMGVSRNVSELQIVSKSSIESTIRFADASSNMVWSNSEIAATKMIALTPSHCARTKPARPTETKERTHDPTRTRAFGPR